MIFAVTSRWLAQLRPALAIYAAAAIAGCGGQLEPAQLQPEFSLPWPPVEGPARAASDDTVTLEGQEVASRAIDTAQIGTDLQLGPTSSLAWAIYTLSGFGPEVELDSIAIDYSLSPGDPDTGTQLYVGLANYDRQTWQWFPLGPSPATLVPSAGVNFISPAGRVHVACVLGGNGSATLDRLQFHRTGAGTFAPVIQSVTRRSGFSGETFQIAAIVDNDVDSDYSWTFSGATPATSTEKSPTITLGGPGCSAASLTVSNPIGGATFDFTLFAVDTADIVWNSSGFDNRLGCQIPITGPSSGNLAWRYFAGGNPNSPGEVLSCAVYDAAGNIYFGTKRGLIALNPDGSFRWRFDPGNWIVTAPAVAEDGAVFFGVWTDGHYALESDGSLRWHDTANIASSSGDPLLHDGAVYFVGGDKRLHGFDQATGSPVITSFEYTDTYNELSHHSCLTGDGLLLFGNDSTVFAYDTVTDALEWTYGLPGLAGGPVLSLDEQTAYAISHHGFVYALRVTDGEELYSANADVDGIFGWPNPFMTADGTLNVVSERFTLHQLNADSGATLQELLLPLGEESTRPAAVDYGGNYYLSANDERELYAIDTVGTVLWQYTLGAQSQTAPTIAPNGNLLVGCHDGYIYCFGPGSGETLEPPYILGISDSQGLEGAEVTLSATLAGGAPDSYNWDFGGGATPDTSTEPTPQIILGSPGSYDSSLTVGNTWGLHSFNFTLQVLPDN